MAKVRGTRGYSSYRGRRNGKGLLAAVLALVLIAACGFLFAQRYIVYVADGSFRFELPWKKPQADAPSQDDGAAQDGGDATAAPDDTELVIEPPEVTVILPVRPVTSAASLSAASFAPWFCRVKTMPLGATNSTW